MPSKRPPLIDSIGDLRPVAMLCFFVNLYTWLGLSALTLISVIPTAGFSATVRQPFPLSRLTDAPLILSQDIEVCRNFATAQGVHASSPLNSPNTFLPPDSRGTPPIPWQSLAACEWRPLDRPWTAFTPGYQGVWLRFTVQNSTQKASSIVFHLHNAMIEHVLFYLYDPHDPARTIIQSLRSGLYVPYHKRPLADRRPHFKAHIGPGETRTILAYAEATIVYFIPTIAPLDGYHVERTKEERLWGIYVGIILVMIAYNMMVALWTREPYYFYYSLSIMFLQGTTFWTLEGLTPMWIFTEWPQFHQGLLLTGFGWGCIFGLRFFQLLLQTKNRMGLIHRLATGLMWVIAPLTVLPFFERPWWLVYVLNGLGSVGGSLAISGASIALSKGQRAAGIYLASWLTLIATGMSHTLMTLGLLPHSWMATYGFHVGSIIEVLLLSIAVSDRINELRQQNIHHEQDLAIAQAISHTLIHTHNHFPSVKLESYFQPAERLGGDWYSHFSLEKHRCLFIFCGDVTGHGFSAALTTGLIAGIVYSHMSALEESPSSVNMMEEVSCLLQRCNQILHADGETRRQLMTMIAVVIEIDTGKFFIANAGHPAAMHIKKGTGKISTLVGSSPILGFKSQAIFRIRQECLEPGDSLLLYTDGLTENEGPKGKTLSSQRIRRQIRDSIRQGSPLLSDVMKTAQSLWQGNPARDDCTVLAVTWQPQSASGAGTSTIETQDTPLARNQA